jgi:transcriptional regulator with XRE-family HTH domain
MAVDRKLAIAFGKYLWACRKRAGLTQEALSRRASLHRTEIGWLEHGERLPRIDTLIKLASGLAVPPEELLGGINRRPDRIQRGEWEFQDRGDVPSE